MHEYDKSTIEEFIKKIRGNNITNIFPVKLFKVTYIESHYGNYCYYSPHYASETYNFTLDDAKGVCLDNRKSGRQFLISEIVTLYVESINCRILLRSDIDGIKNFCHINSMFSKKPTIDSFVFYMFMLSLFKNKCSPSCIDLFQIYKKEIQDSKIEYCDTLKSYSSEFYNSFLSWNITEHSYDNVNFIIAEYIKNLQ